VCADPVLVCLEKQNLGQCHIVFRVPFIKQDLLGSVGDIPHSALHGSDLFRQPAAADNHFILRGALVNLNFYFHLCNSFDGSSIKKEPPGVNSFTPRGHFLRVSGNTFPFLSH